MSDIIEKVRLELKNMCTKQEDGKYIFKIYTDYRDEISGETVVELIEEECPIDAFYEKLNEWTLDAEFYEEPALISSIKERLNAEELELFNEHYGEIQGLINDTVVFYYDPDDFNRNIRVNLMLDTGDADTDFTCCNILNYWSNGDLKVEKESPILWLAKTQDKKELLQCELLKYDTEDSYPDDTFVKTVIEELENLHTSLGCLTFLVHMSLLDLLRLQTELNNEDDSKDSYIIVDKSVYCGLFDSWNGGGSLFEIQLDKDIQIPYKNIFKLQIDEGFSKPGFYTVCDVYGMNFECWKNVLSFPEEETESPAEEDKV